MTAADSLVAWLESAPSVDGATIVDWRCDVVRSEGVRVGIRDSAVGGPYEGPGLATRLAGSLDLHWSDGRITRTGLDRRAIMDPAREIEVGAHHLSAARQVGPREPRPAVADRSPQEIRQQESFEQLLHDLRREQDAARHRRERVREPHDRRQLCHAAHQAIQVTAGRQTAPPIRF